MLSYERLKELLKGERLPLAFVDLDAFDRNVARTAEMVQAHGIPIRPASKSLRVVSLLERLLAHSSGVFRGVLCYSCQEAAFLAERGIDDLLVAYPPFQRPDLEIIAGLSAEGRKVTVMSDCRESVDRLSEVATARKTVIQVALCMDMSLELAGGRVHMGVRRSPLHSTEAVVALARHIQSRPGVRFQGLMAYEAQIAGLGDSNPFAPRLNSLKAAFKRLSAAELKHRRMNTVNALEQAGLAPALVNGGGSGSLDTTTPDTGVSEVTAGSAFFKSHLFDYYRAPHMRALEPAAFFAVEITRRPDDGFVTCLGGGYVASGPTFADKAPRPWLPPGLELLDGEMAGEVQTPLKVPPGLTLNLGDPVVFRHAKAGELAERFNEYLLIQGGKIADRVPTYRGEGMCFL